MDKMCKICGEIVPYNVRFCSKCGSNEFVSAVNEEDTSLLNEGDNQYQNQMEQSQQPLDYKQPQYNQQVAYNNQQIWQPPVPQNQPKKGKTGLIIGISVGCLVVLAIIGKIAENAFQEQGYGNAAQNSEYSSDINGDDYYTNSNEESSTHTVNGIEYTKGSFDGTTYINEWADIKLNIPMDFFNADSDTYSLAENSTTECGVYFMADDTMSVIYICYEKLPSLVAYDEEKYLDSAMKNLESQSDITYEIDSVYTITNIAGNAYVTAECDFDNGYGNFVQSIYVRKIDDYMVLISAISNSTTSNNALVDSITSVD